MLDKIYVNKMEFYGYHGVLPEENTLGQRFIVDLVVEADLKQAGLTDELEESRALEAQRLVRGDLRDVDVPGPRLPLAVRLGP